MRLSIIGSHDAGHSPQWPLFGSDETFQQACEEIGGVIAANEHQLYVAHDGEEYCDYHTVKGYIEQVRDSGQRPGHGVTVFRPIGHPYRPFSVTSGAHPRLFTYRSVRGYRWRTARFSASIEADCTILAGGAARTEMTGHLLAAMKRPLLPLGAFGGAAESVLADIASDPGSQARLPDPLTVERLTQPWSDGYIELLDKWLGRTPLPRLVVVHGKDETGLASLLSFLDKDTEGKPLVMRDTQVFGATLPEKWEQTGEGVDGAIILITPDDEGGESGKGQYRPRSRQNVLLELGWIWGKLDRSRMLLLVRDVASGDLELPSDVQGLELIKWENDPVERADVIREFVRSVR